jgi:hypothetical protein
MVAQDRWASGAAAGATCPAPMTRAALLAMRAAGTLSTSCHYTITDFVQGRFFAGTTLTLHAVSATELGEEVLINSLYDNEAWEGRYDIDTNNLLECRDNLGNVVLSAVVGRVASFDWGNASWTGNVIEGPLTLTYGSLQPVSRCVFRAGTVDLTNATGSLMRVKVDGTLTLTNSNQAMDRVTIDDDATYNASGYTGGGTALGCRVVGFSTVNISGSTQPFTFQFSRVESGSVVNHNNVVTAGATLSLTRSTVSDAATINHTASVSPAALNGCSVFGASTVLTLLRGSFTSTSSIYGPTARVVMNQPTGVVGDFTFDHGSVRTNGFVQHFGTGAIVMSSMDISSLGSVQTVAGSNSPINMSYTDIANSSLMQVSATSTSGAIDISRSQLRTNAVINKTGTGALSLSVSSMLTGRIDLTGVRSFQMSYSTLANFSSLTLSAAAGGGVTDQMFYTTITDAATVTFSATGATANTLGYSSIRGVAGAVTFSGTNNGTQARRFDVVSGTATFSNNTVPFPLVNNIGVRDGGVFSVTGNTADQNIQNNTMESGGGLFVTNKSVASSVTLNSLRAFGSLTTQGTAGNCVQVSVAIGVVVHNGGALSGCCKSMAGTLTTGAFNHTNIYHNTNVSQVLTAANNGRGRDYFNNNLV